MSQLVVTLPLGSTGRGLLRAVALAVGEDAVVDLLVAGGGCDTLAQFIEDRPFLSTSCDAGCALRACRTGLATLVEAIDSALVELDPVRAEIVLEDATLALTDLDGDRVTDTMEGGFTTGLWTGEAAVEPDALGAQVRARRVPPVP